MIVALSFALSPAMQHELPDPEAEAFWTYISETHPYTEWEMWPGYDGMYPGQSPHGKFLKLYANDIAIEAAENDEPMPHGAILVKENYGPDKEKLLAVTPMYKVEGYNQGGGNWFWAKYGPKGKAMAAGKVDSCINCHAARKNMGWIFTRPK
jgi:hypothetical protein